MLNQDSAVEIATRLVLFLPAPWHVGRGAKGFSWRGSDLKSRRQNRHGAARRGAGRRRAPIQAALAIFAHDIRTALTGILALGELLASSNLGERERRWAAGIKDSAEHLASLTTLVIDAAKADSGSLTLQQEVFRPRRADRRAGAKR